MQSPRARALVAVVAVALAVVLFVVLSGGEDDSGETTVATEQTTTTPAAGGQGSGSGGERERARERRRQREKPEIPTIRIRNGQPVGGVAELEFEKGEKIEFFVESDVTDHVHLHGYDVMKDVAAGDRIKFSVPATIDGVFEAELEDSVVPIAEITVNP